MPYNFVVNSFHTKKLCGSLSSREVHFFVENGHFAFLSPFWEVTGNICHFATC